MAKVAKWDIFLSHSSSDAALAASMKDDVEKNKIDGRKIVVWLDETDIPFGGNITKYVNEGLTDSQRIAVLMTPAYFRSASGWTDAEWHAALFEDPDNRSERMIPILAEDCNVPTLLRPLRRVDVRGSRYQTGIKELVSALTRRAQRRSLPSAVSPIPSAAGDEVTETLHSNIFEFSTMPQRLYTGVMTAGVYPRRGRLISSDQTAARIAMEIGTRDIPVFQTFRDQIRTFSNLGHTVSPLSRFVEPATIRGRRIVGKNVSRTERTTAIALINACIQKHMLNISMRVDPSNPNRYFYPAFDTSGKNIVTWTPSQKQSTREVAKPYPNRKTGEVAFWRHHAAVIRAIQVGDGYALQIKPTYMLTTDGHAILSGPSVGKTISKWTSPERNYQVFYNVLFWRWTIGYTPISTGDEALSVDNLPISFELRRGIADDKRDFRPDALALVEDETEDVEIEDYDEDSADEV